jgi:hypothetical protein
MNKDHVGFFEREKRIKYSEQMKAEIPNEDYDFPNREVVVIPYNNPNEYHG